MAVLGDVARCAGGNSVGNNELSIIDETITTGASSLRCRLSLMRPSRPDTSGRLRSSRTSAGAGAASRRSSAWPRLPATVTSVNTATERRVSSSASQKRGVVVHDQGPAGRAGRTGGVVSGGIRYRHGETIRRATGMRHRANGLMCEGRIGGRDTKKGASRFGTRLSEQGGEAFPALS